MPNYAIIENNTITNIAIADDAEFAASMGWVLLPEGAAINWVLVDDVWQPPKPASIPNLSFTQLLIGLVTESWITELEAEDWLKGILPAPILTLLDQLPVEQRLVVKIKATRPIEIVRADPLVSSLGVVQGKSEAELDDFFIKYAGI